MANFHTHASVAISVSAIAAAALHTAGIININFALICILFGSIGGLLPDIDSDHSTSIRLIFNLMGVIIATAVMIKTGQNQGIIPAIGWGGSSFIILRFGFFHLFTQLTHHRGIFHSLPMALLFGLITSITSRYALHYSDRHAWFVALFIMGGYLTHLLLDELFSVDLAGIRFKSSFLSAITLFEWQNWPLYLSLYVLIMLLVPWTPSWSILFETILNHQLVTQLWNHRWL